MSVFHYLFIMSNIWYTSSTIRSFLPANDFQCWEQLLNSWISSKGLVIILWCNRCWWIQCNPKLLLHYFQIMRYTGIVAKRLYASITILIRWVKIINLMSAFKYTALSHKLYKYLHNFICFHSIRIHIKNISTDKFNMRIELIPMPVIIVSQLIFPI